MLQIGNVTLKTNLLLAPIAGYCDLAFRLVVRKFRDETGLGVGLACTDLLCPQAMLRETDKTMWLAATCPEDSPVCMQLYGRHPEVMAEAAQWAAAHGATTIDINMGCPVDKVTKKNGGSMLLCEPTLATDIAQAVVKAVDLPVTTKIRLGWDDDSFITQTLPPALADVGIQAITVHGRTTEQKFRGEARLEGITQVVEAMAKHHPDIPVIGNGDVGSPEDAKRMLDVTGCAGVMIGRAALGQPWLFRDTAHYLRTGELPTPISRLEKAQTVLEHFENLYRFRNEKEAVNMIRTRISWYSKHLQPWPRLRREVHVMKSANEFRDYWQTGLETLAQAEDTPPTNDNATSSAATH